MNAASGCYRIALLTTLVSSTVVGCSKRARVWVTRQDHYEIAVEGATKLIATTHNGEQTALGVEDRGDKVTVDAEVRGGGADPSDAQAALDAILVSAERRGDAIRVYWDWTTDRSPAWNATVSFDIKLPPGLDVELTTHNGRITARGIAGGCVLETHNGRIIAEGTGARMDATTHNGALDITTTAADVFLDTHNGGIHARLETEGDLGGHVTSHNGGVSVTLGDTTAVMLDCSTSNGRIHCDRNLERALAKRTSLKGSVRGGDKVLHIQTSNGSIKIQ